MLTCRQNGGVVVIGPGTDRLLFLHKVKMSIRMTPPTVLKSVALEIKRGW